MAKFWARFSLKQFKIISIIGLFAGDIAICSYVYLNLRHFWNSPLFAQSLKQAAQIVGQNPQFADAAILDFSDPSYMGYMVNVMVGVMWKTIIAALIIQAIFYLFYYFRAIVAYWYLNLIAWGGFLTAIFILAKGSTTYGVYYYFIPQMVIYLVVALGLIHFKAAYQAERLAAKNKNQTPSPT